MLNKVNISQKSLAMYLRGILPIVRMTATVLSLKKKKYIVE